MSTSKSVFTKEDLVRFQSECLYDKYQRSLAKVGEWYVRWEGKVYVAFSGGKDSSVLADVCANWCKASGRTLYLMFANTGLEYPEIRRHVEFFAEWLRNTYKIEVVLDIVRPQVRFDEVVRKCGYPVISKEVSNTVSGAKNNLNNGVYSHRLCKLGVQKEEYGGLFDSGKYDYANTLTKSMYRQDKWRALLDVDFNVSSFCCDVMKKKPAEKYEKETGRKAIVGTMAWESQNRRTAWLRNGCNAFKAKRPTSQPLSFWTEQDVLQYIKQYKIPIASVYGDVQYAVESEQIRWGDVSDEMAVMDSDEHKLLTTTGCKRTGCIFCAFGCHLEKEPSRFQRLKETHPRQYEYCIGGGEYVDGVWKPNKQGLGMGHVFDELNKIYGDDFIKY